MIKTCFKFSSDAYVIHEWPLYTRKKILKPPRPLRVTLLNRANWETPTLLSDETGLRTSVSRYDKWDKVHCRWRWWSSGVKEDDIQHRTCGGGEPCPAFQSVRSEGLAMKGKSYRQDHQNGSTGLIAKDFLLWLNFRKRWRWTTWLKDWKMKTHRLP